MPASSSRQIIGHSPQIVRLRALVARLREHGGSVVITGEPGAGKELVARGLRRDGAPFVTVDAATIMASTAESQLFGHEKGAFTGAHTARTGLLEQADGGVLYIDEIANMPLEVQAKLLRALQEKEVLRLGGTRPKRLQFRIVCASNQDLEALSAQGSFRFDLYTRLSVFAIAVPALRERVEDIPALFSFFCQSFAPGISIDAAVWPTLSRYAWPGNVRELSNAAQYACVMADNQHIGALDLPDKLHVAPQRGATAPAPPLVAASAGSEAKPAAPPAGQSLRSRLHAFEVQVLVQAYAEAHGNVSQMARTLGIDRSTLHTKLRTFNIYTPRPAPSHAQAANGVSAQSKL